MIFLKLSKHWWHEPAVITGPYREPFFRVDLNHALEQRLAVRRDKMGHVKHPALHLLQELTQIVMVKRKSTLQEQKREGEECDSLNLTKTQEDAGTATPKALFEMITHYCGEDSPPREQRG